MNQGSPPGVLLGIQAGQHRRGTGTDVTSQNHIKADRKGHQTLACHQKQNADRYRGTLNYDRNHRSQQNSENRVVQTGQNIQHILILPQPRHGILHHTDSQKQCAEPQNNFSDFFHHGPLSEHHKNRTHKKNHRSNSGQVKSHKLRSNRGTDIGSKDNPH